MRWGAQRQLFYLGVLLVFFGSLAYLIGYPYLHKAPSCFDHKQNGDETGIDCGGSTCTLACSNQVDKISVLWSRAFRVVPGRYNAVAYLENHNKNAAVQRINYTFRFADKDNTYVGKRDGQTFIPPAGRFAVFEPGINTGNLEPVFTTFEFTETPVWQQVSDDKINQMKVTTTNIKLENENVAPRLSATVKNNSLFDIPNLGVVVILYDAAGNAISVSRTYVDVLKGGDSKDVNFTWPEPIQGTTVSKEIIPMFDIFSVKF